MVYSPTDAVTHPGTNQVWRSATTLVEANALPLSQTGNQHCLSEQQACSAWLIHVCEQFHFLAKSSAETKDGEFSLSWRLIFGLRPNLRLHNFAERKNSATIHP